LTIETEREADGRWLADIPALPGVMAYGKTKPEAIRAVRALALRVLADDIEDEALPFDVVRFVQQ
jgi:predicted RNase H-like HicB family nuclease